MKKLLFFTLLTTLMIGCRYDDSALWAELESKELTAKLEVFCNRLNTNIVSLQTIVTSLEHKDKVTGVVPVKENGVEVGYTITFTKSGSITIYNGLDGDAPEIGVTADDDGNYYWTVFGEWLTVADGERMLVSDSIPRLKVEDGYWCLSCDNGVTWKPLDTATGLSETFFKSIKDDGNFLNIVLANGYSFVIPYFKEIRLLTIGFLSKDNPLLITSDLKCEAVNDTVFECRIPNIVDNKKLIPVFDFLGEKVIIDGEEIISGESVVDFSKPVKISVIGINADTLDYTVNVYSYTGLPVITINTENGQKITSKDKYLNATIKIVEDIITKASGDIFESAVRIKGRGNTTWYGDKKPYKLKFDEKVSLFGEAKDKEWVLLANHFDHTLIRTELAMHMGSISDLAYTTSTHYAELIVNGEYLGTYQVAEQQKISEGRVNVTDDGFLIEIDAKAAYDDITFRLGTIPQPLNIKDPEVEVNSDQYNNIVNFMQQVEAALYGENWLDKENGWQKYMDMASFVDWYLINEIARNNDAVFFSSCFMNYAPGGKLCMGPLWDFDLAFGNYTGNSSTEGFYIKDNIGWYVRLFSDPEFKQCVKDRYKYFYSQKEELLNEINSCAEYLKWSAIENDNKWDILYKDHYLGNVILGSYYNEVTFLKQWLNDRMEWLKSAIEEL